jgi:hypothetical protein
MFPRANDVDVENLKPQPFVPTAALLASWFPKRWLEGNPAERAQITELLTRSYSTGRPLSLKPYPLPAEEEKFIQESIAAANQSLRHFYGLYVVSIDWTEPFSRLEKRFARWLKENDPRKRREARLKGIEHLKKGKKGGARVRYYQLVNELPYLPPRRSAQQNLSARAPLERLTCYRLSKRPPTERRKLIQKINWLTPGEYLATKISRAKKAVEKDLMARAYPV